MAKFTWRKSKSKTHSMRIARHFTCNIFSLRMVERVKDRMREHEKLLMHVMQKFSATMYFSSRSRHGRETDQHMFQHFPTNNISIIVEQVEWKKKPNPWNMFSNFSNNRIKLKLKNKMLHWLNDALIICKFSMIFRLHWTSSDGNLTSNHYC